jgi:hypothetical protein
VRGLARSLGNIDVEGTRDLRRRTYPLGVDALRSIAAFCDRYTLAVRVAAGSWHYPAACLRLEFSPADTGPGGLRVIPLDEPEEEFRAGE